MMILEQYAFSRNCTLNFEFGSFPGLAHVVMRPGQQAAAAHQACDYEGKQLVCLHPFHPYTIFLFFTFCIVFNKLHGIFNTLL